MTPSPSPPAMPAEHEFKLYKRVGEIEARPWTAEEANRYQFGGKLGLNTISVSKADHYVACHATGMVARNPANHDDQWYIAPDYFAKHYAPAALSRQEQPQQRCSNCGQPDTECDGYSCTKVASEAWKEPPQDMREIVEGLRNLDECNSD